MKHATNSIKGVTELIINTIIKVLANKYFFTLFAVINLYPLFSNTFFATLDGPAHLYNAKLINDLLVNNNLFTGSFYKFNTYIVPNWSGHFLLSFFLIFLPAWMAEKAVLIICLLALPFAFRYLLSSLNTNKVYSYFVFPFTYSSFFFLGFYNFIIGIILLLIGLGFYYKQGGILRFKTYLLLFILSVFIYLSHPLLLLIWLVCIGLMFLNNSINEYHKERFIDTKRILKHTLFTLLALLPVIFLTLNYLLLQPATDGLRIPFIDLIKAIAKIRPLISINMDYEHKYTYILFTIFIVFAASLLFNFINKKNRTFIISSFKKSLLIALISFILLILYFVLPDQMAQGGFISFRINLLFFLFIIIFFSYFEMKKWLLILTIILTFYIHFTLLAYHNSIMINQNKRAAELFECNKYITDNSTMICVDKTGNWLQKHLPSYAGLGKGVILNDNYEAYMEYFPLVWKNYAYINVKLFSEASLYNINNKSINKQALANYILLYGDYPLNDDGKDGDIKKELAINYTLTYTSSNKFVKIFKLNKK